MGLKSNGTLSIRLDESEISKLETLRVRSGARNNSAVIRSLVNGAFENENIGSVLLNQGAIKPAAKGQPSQNHR